MTLLQFGIGTVNDLVDADHDAVTRPDKPIPAGLVRRDAALAVALVVIAAGLGISGILGPAVLLIGLAGLGAGLAYDLALKGTAWAWVPFAVGIALLPAYAWVGATGSLPAPLLALMALAAIEGAALALANALVDIDGDAAVLRPTPAVRLGPRRSWWVVVSLQALAIGLALGSLIAIGPEAQDQPSGAAARVGTTAGFGAIALGVALVVVGLGLSRAIDRRRRRFGWEAQAVGAAAVAVGWAMMVLAGAVGVGDAG